MVQVICGILRLDGAPADPETVERMLATMRPACPVAEIIATDGPVAMGCLAAHPLHQPAQPSLLPVRDGMGVGDLRIYGGDLAAALNRGRYDDLHGDFALAIWRQGVLTLVRDRYGVRPLQYTIAPNRHLAFASMPDALLDTGLAARKPDDLALRFLASTLAPIPPRTYFADINSVEGGSVVECGTRRPLRTWRHSWRRLPRLLSSRTSTAELAQELRRLTEQAVARRLPSTGTVAGHFSGGLDSTSLGVIAARQVAPEGRRFLGYSFQETGADDAPDVIDETPAVRAAAGQSGNIEIVPIPSVGRHRWLSEEIDRNTLLPLGTNVPEEQVLTHAADAGASVILSGWGGDQAVTWRGGSGLAELFLLGRWSALATHLGERSRRTGDPAWRIFRSAVLMECLPAGWRRWIRGETLTTVPSLARHKPGPGDIPGRNTGPFSQRRRQSWLDHWWLPAHFEQFAQRGLRHGIAYAMPLLDHDLVDFALSIPGALLQRDGLDRAPYRAAMTGILPDRVRLRTDKLAPWPLEGWRLAQDRNRLLAEVETLAQSAGVRHYVDMASLAHHLQQWPDPATLAAEIEATTRDGAQNPPGDGLVCNALMLAHVVAVLDGAME